MNPNNETLNVKNNVLEARIDLKDVIPIYGFLNMCKKANQSYEPEKFRSTILDGAYHLFIATYQGVSIITSISLLEKLLK